MPLASFHPAVARWFERTFETPTPPQAAGWPSIQRREDTLIAAPTGSGKTLAAFLVALDDLVKRGLAGTLDDGVQVLYVSPLKALGTDVEKNLQEPLRGIRAELAAMGLPEVSIRTAVRSGDTPASQRSAMTKRPPHLFVTTPESLYILLTSEGGRAMLKSVRTVIIDEIHALVRDKRGAHLALSLERLDDLVGARPVRVGLSATQRPIEAIARFLVGAPRVSSAGAPRCAIVDGGHGRRMDLALALPRSPLESVMSNEVWEEVYDHIASLAAAHRTTLVFVNTRRLAERATRLLSERLGREAVTSHHGSLSREHRLDAEQRLKSGALSVLVATSSLELGIDIGDVDLVAQIGSPHSIAAFLQRVGRSGHRVGAVPEGRLFPTSRDDLVECAALLRGLAEGELDRVRPPEAPLDVLAQQIVAEVAAGERDEDELYAAVRRAWPYRALPRERFDAVVRMLADGFATARGRRGAFLHHDEVGRRLRPRRNARLSAITSGGAIPDTFDYEVRLEPESHLVGSVNEDFAIESMAGDVFQLGNASYRILRVEPGVVRVADARGQPPSMPFWLGEAPARSDELSLQVARLRGELAERFERDGEAARVWASQALGLGDVAAGALLDYLGAATRSLGVMPTQEVVVLERFFDETGGMHLVLHAPFGSRANRAWGLALRKRFCRGFNVELQAAATEDAIVLSLGPTHSFPLEDVFAFLRAETVRELLVQALLDAPMFQTRWRWNATRALAVLRFRGGKKVPPRFQRMDADDLLAVCFPDQVACLENVQGDREIPDHPLVAQTIDDCLHEAMDVDALERILTGIADGRIACLARDLTEPSPLAQEILSAKPYAFLDDAPLEERRTQAVLSRRWLDPKTASDLGALDPAAIARVQAESWPDARDADELHDALGLVGALSAAEGKAGGWEAYFAALVGSGRATSFTHGGVTLWVAGERLPQWRVIAPEGREAPEIEVPPRRRRPWAREEALREVVRGRLEAVGPTTAAELAATLGVHEADAAGALSALEGEGFVLRGRFRQTVPEGRQEEWCERRLLARIHRYTLDRLRKEIEPVSAADFLRFCLAWQHADPASRMKGPEGLWAVVEQLVGFEAAAASWESDLLPLRLEGYDPAWLDGLCLSGRVSWARRRPASELRASGPVRSTPIALLQRSERDAWLGGEPWSDDGLSPDAVAVWKSLEAQGASFFDDLVRHTGLLRTQVEAALAELVARGRVSSDGFTGLRALIAPRRGHARRGRRARAVPYGMEGAGRWSALAPAAARPEADGLEAIAWSLLRRWGVVVRRLLDRESGLPPWRDLVRVYRRLEANGSVRGGRFVAGLTGEQFALPEAVGALRRARRAPRDGRLVSIAASDPLNLLGILTPGPRLASTPKNRLLFRDGVPVAIREGGEVRFLQPLPDEARWAMQTALTRREVPPAVKAYLGTAC